MLIAKLSSFIKETLIGTFDAVTSKEGLKSLWGVLLYRTAFYLMLNSVILAAAGFFFWMVAARLYTTEAVGLASAAIAAMGLLAVLSTLGLDFALIRFLPNAGEKARDMINSCFTIGGLVAITLALIFIAGLSFWSPALLPIREHPIFLTFFVVSVVAATLNPLVQRSFVAKRRSGFALAQGLVSGLLRFIPLLILAAFFQTFGIFSSLGIALSLAVAISILFLIPRIETGYYPFPVVKKEVINEIVHFSFANYAAGLFWAIPSLILPLMVVNMLGVEQNAYFYIGWTTASILSMIPVAVSTSLFVEGSHNEERLRHEVTRSLKLIIFILIPAVLLMLLVGAKLLLLFGGAYSENATQLLWLLALSTLPLSVNQTYFSIKRVEMQMRSVMGLSVFMTVAVLVISYLLLPRMGIVGIGIARLTSQGMIALIIGRKLWRRSGGLGVGD